MLKNYFKIAIRNVVRHKAFSSINIVGLAVGIAACLLLFTVVTYELSYDTFQSNYNNIYRVVDEDKYADGITYQPGIPFPALEALRTDFPTITTGALFSNNGSQVTVLGDEATANTSKKFIEDEGFFYADPEFFRVFHFDWLSGTPALLSEPNIAVLSTSMAKKYFGSAENAIGKFLKIDNAVTVKVAGIIKDAHANSDFRLGLVCSYATMNAASAIYPDIKEWHSTTSNFQVYMLLPQNTKANVINKSLEAFDKKYFRNNGSRSIRTHFLQPLSALHFDSRFGSFGDHVTDKATLWTLSLIGVFIIIMACINFVNLSTAQAVGRSKEVGIRKVLGGNKTQLFLQVMGETGLIVLASMVLAVVMAEICLPFIKHIAFINEELSLFNTPTIAFLAIVFFTVTILAGLYPAFIMSGFRPAVALKNKITSATVGGISLRRGLVVLQFAISQVLIIGTIVAISQMNFIRNADLGFNKEAVLLLNANADSSVFLEQEAFKQKLLQTPGVQSVSFSSDAPSSDNTMGTNFAYNHLPDEKYTLYLKYADEDYFKTFGLQLLAGTTFSKSDTLNQVVINETLANRLTNNKPEQVIGKEIRRGSSEWKTIVGVVKDFKARSLRDEVLPIMIAEQRNLYTVTAIKIKSTNLAKTQAYIESQWNNFFPEYAYTTSFMDENINNFYQQEQQLSLLYKIFACIAIFISCLGLYGLVSFMAVQRTKEIGVRKVLGASVKNIVYLFSKEFTILIFIGFVVATPVAWYVMHGWLQNFVYRTNITAGVFVIAMLISVVVAWITVGYKSIKAALTNPVKSLRSE